MSVTLDVTKRDKDTPRSSESLLGVVYGPKQESLSISIDKKVFEKTLKEAGESTIITLKGLGEEIEVLVHDVAFNAEKGGVEHVDFYAIERGKELTTNVTLEFVGEAPIEKTGATVNKVLHEVEVTCRPSVLPSSIEVDISPLTEESSQITIGDLVVADDVKIGNVPEDVVVNVSAAREEEPEEPAESVDMGAIEVEGEKKEGDAEEAAAEEEKA